MTPGDARVTLAETLAHAAADLPDVVPVVSDDGTEWAVDGEPFARVTAAGAEFRLAPAIARAALGTADTARSTRGASWVAFSPRELDRFAQDRARAWLASAYRHAEEAAG